MVRPRRTFLAHGLDGSGGCEAGQPDDSQGEVRLLAVDQVGRTIMLTVSGGLRFELDQTSLPRGIPPVGEVIGSDLLEALAAGEQRKLVARDLMTMIGRRLQPVARLRRKLLDKGHPPEAVGAVVAMMQERGLCSDRLYAEAYCRDTLLLRPVGPRYLVDQLRSRQVPLAVAQQAVGAVLTPEWEEELAMQAAAAKWKLIRVTDDAASLAKVVRFLLGRGFNPAVAHQAARKTRSSRDEQDTR